MLLGIFILVKIKKTKKTKKHTIYTPFELYAFSSQLDVIIDYGKVATWSTLFLNQCIDHSVQNLFYGTCYKQMSKMAKQMSKKTGATHSQFQHGHRNPSSCKRLLMNCSPKSKNVLVRKTCR